MPRLHPYTRENLLTLARDLAKTYGESLTLTAFRRETGLSQHLIFDRYGSWPLTKDAFEDDMTQRFPRCGPCRYYERAEDLWKPSTTTPPNDSPPRTP